LNYLKKKFPEAKYYQISATGKKLFADKKNIIHMPAVKFLQLFI
ncbi:MAG: ATP-binding protein, partial [Deltaproteobacteria bacterium]